MSFSARVSIPYRQATNTELTAADRVKLLRFNSLQVGYKQALAEKIAERWGSFNSLQVGYKLSGHCKHCLIHHVSIPYRQATNCYSIINLFINQGVSIPYRQATNCILLRSCFITALVSIPYRQATNSILSNRRGILMSRFNSLQVGYKPPAEKSQYTGYSCFNSLQVGYKRPAWCCGIFRLAPFQFLIGRLQTHITPVNVDINPEFQFLIGRLQTKRPCHIQIFFKVFQFLIGRLQTFERSFFFSRYSAFQFLIGRLQTPAGFASGHDSPRFQFLIGRLQTVLISRKSRSVNVFQFLIGRLQTLQGIIRAVPIKARFNSLQVGYKRSFHSNLPDLGCRGFNSLQVGYKLSKNGQDSQPGRRFQFLIGRLQTERIPLRGKHIPGFQFLIGRLQTEIFIQVGYLLDSFNSLQVGYKLCSRHVDRCLAEDGFNSLQVGYKLSTNLHFHPIYLLVSIPYRQATNYTYCFLRINAFSRFQFLIGRLQTLPFEWTLHRFLRFNSLQVGYKRVP